MVEFCRLVFPHWLCGKVANGFERILYRALVKRNAGMHG